MVYKGAERLELSAPSYNRISRVEWLVDVVVLSKDLGVWKTGVIVLLSWNLNGLLGSSKCK